MSHRPITDREAAAIQAAPAAAYEAAARAILSNSKRDADTKAEACILVARIIPANGTADAAKDYARQALSLAARRANDASKETPVGVSADDYGTAGLSTATSAASQAADRAAQVTDADRIRAALTLGGPEARAAAAAYLDSAQRSTATLSGAAIRAAGLKRGRPAAAALTATLDTWTADVRAAAQMGLTEAPAHRITEPRTGGGKRTRAVPAEPYTGRHSDTAASTSGTGHGSSTYAPGSHMWPTQPHRALTPAAARAARTNYTDDQAQRWTPEPRPERPTWTEDAIALSDRARYQAAAEEEAMRAARSTTPNTASALMLTFGVERDRLPRAVWSIIDTASGIRLTGGEVEDQAHADALRHAARDHRLLTLVPVKDAAPTTPEAKRAEALAAAPRKSPKAKTPSRRSRATVTGATVTR